MNRKKLVKMFAENHYKSSRISWIKKFNIYPQWMRL